VTIAPQENPAAPQEVRMAIAATERLRRTIGVWLGYNTSQGAGANAFWEDRNLFGYAEYLKLQAAAGQQTDDFVATFRRPDFLVTNQNFLTTAEFTDNTPIAYDSRQGLVSPGIERHFGRWLTLGIAVEGLYSNVEQSAFADILTTAQRTRIYSLVGVPGYLKLDTTDNLLNPTEGWRALVSVTPAHTLSSPDLTFVTGIATASTYWSALPHDRLVLAGQAAVASLDGAPLGELPADQRIYAGGGGSGAGVIRSYGYQTAGPLDADNIPVGGKSSLAVNLEARIMATPQIGVVPFFDAGSYYETRVPQIGRGLLYGVGLGLRYYTGFGPLRLDLATPLRRRSGNAPIQVYNQPRPGLLMRSILCLLRVAGSLAGGALLLALLAFAAIQSPPGRAWLERTVAAAASTGKLRLSIAGLQGLVPFRFTVTRIGFSDAAGTFAVVHDVGFTMRAAPLLQRRIEIRTLTAREADFTRPPHFGPPPRLIDILRRLRPPHLPLEVALDRLAIGRLALGKSVLATAAGHTAFADGRGAAALDLSRTDGHAGNLEFAAELFGAAPRLALRLEANEPSGRLVDRLLGHGDHLPLALSLVGEGPLADWHGRLAVSAGIGARIDALLALAVTDKLAFGTSGRAVVARLMPPRWNEILGDRIAFSLRATAAAARLRVDRLRVAAALGELVASGTLTPVDGAIDADLSGDVPQLARLGDALGLPLTGAAALVAKIGGSIDEPVLDARATGRGLALQAPRVLAATANLSAHVAWQRAAGLRASVGGTADGVHSGLAVADALLGRHIALAAALRRDPAGTLDFERIALASGDAEVSGSGSFAPVSRRLVAGLELRVARLGPLGPLLGGRLAGEVTATARLAGPLDRLHLDVAALGRGLAFDGTSPDWLRLEAQVADLAAPKATLDGSFRSGGLAGTLGLAAEFDSRSELVLPRLRLAAAGAVVAGALRMALATGRITGRIKGRVPNLAAWSRLADIPLGGSVQFTAGLAAEPKGRSTSRQAAVGSLSGPAAPSASPSTMPSSGLASRICGRRRREAVGWRSAGCAPAGSTSPPPISPSTAHSPAVSRFAAMP
jgi:autotransporter translocation and assembly factor TamB